MFTLLIHHFVHHVMPLIHHGRGHPIIGGPGWPAPGWAPSKPIGPGFGGPFLIG